MRSQTVLLLSILALLLGGCEPAPDDDDVTADDDDATPDDDDSTPDDDDSTPDDDDATTDDDDATPDDDDSADDDDATTDDDDSATGTCLPDPGEPNDHLSSATPMTDGVWTTYYVCGDDPDWYALDVQQGDLVAAAVLFEHETGDINATLYDETGAVVHELNSGTSNELAVATATASGTWHLEVFVDGSHDDGGALYDLDLTVGVQPCLWDWAEPNDVANVVFEIGGMGNYPGLVVCEPQVDWFSRDLESGDVFDVSLFFDHDEGDIDLTIYGPTFNPLLTATSQTDDEVLSLEIIDTGRYYIVVTMAADSGSMPGNAYTLQWELGTDSTCPADVAEPNFNLSGSQGVIPGSLDGLTVCDDNPDFFVVEALPNNELTVTVLFDHSEGNIDLTLVDFVGTVLGSSTSSTDNESASVTFPQEEGVFIEVSLPSDSGSQQGNSYELAITQASPVCPQDSHEPDNDIATAAFMPEGPNILRQVCTGNDDWWTVLGLAGQTLQVDATFEHDEGNIDLELYDADGALLASSLSSTDDEVLSQIMTTDDYVFVRVLLDSDSGAPGNSFDIEYTLN